MTKKVSTAHAKAKLSEIVSRVAESGEKTGIGGRVFGEEAGGG